jgi:hypothetical protein
MALQLPRQGKRRQCGRQTFARFGCLWSSFNGEFCRGAKFEQGESERHAANQFYIRARPVQSLLATCHGADAKGNGPMAKSLKVAPSDLTRTAARNGGTIPLTRVERIISGEKQPPSRHGTSEMPVWGPIFSHVDRDQDIGRVRIDNLARYLRDIQVQ